MRKDEDSLRGERVVAIGLALVSCLAAAAILVPARPAFQDLPVRAALTQALPGAVLGTDPYLVASPYPVHGWLYELVVWPLSLILGAVEATRLVLALSVAALPAAVWHLLRTVGLPGSSAAFVAPLLLSIPVVMGYVPFVASVPLAVFTISALLRLAGRRPGAERRSWAGVAALYLATYGAHAFGYVAAAVGGGAAVLLTVARDQATPGESPARRTARTLRLLMTAAPAGLLVVGSSLLGDGADGATWGPGPLARLASAVDRLSDFLIATADTEAVTVSLGVLVIGAFVSRRPPERRWLAATAATLPIAVLWLALPEHLAKPPIYQLADRFLLPLAVLLPAALGVSLHGVWRWLLAAPLVLGAMLAGTTLAVLLDYGATAGPIERMLARVPDGQVLIGAVEYTSAVKSGLNFVMVSHAPFLYELEGRGRVIAPYGHPHMPIHARGAGADGHVRTHPTELVRLEAARADWVITDAPEQSLPSDLAGPGFQLAPVAREGDLRLLRIDHPAPAGPPQTPAP